MADRPEGYGFTAEVHGKIAEKYDLDQGMCLIFNIILILLILFWGDEMIMVMIFFFLLYSIRFLTIYIYFVVFEFKCSGSSN